MALFCMVLVAITFTRFLADLIFGISHTSFSNAEIMIPREREKSKFFFHFFVDGLTISPGMM